MKGFLRLATERPVVFALVVTGVLYLLMTGSYILGAAASGDVYGEQIGQALGRLMATGCLAFVLWRFGWLAASGLTRFGGARAWLPALLPIVYGIAANLYAYFRDFRFDVSDPALAALVTLNAMSVGLVEETAYRGLVLHAFVRRWGGSRRGILASALLSSLIFGASHMIWAAMGKDVSLAALQSLGAFLSGIVYAALVLYGESIWPAVVFHGLANAVAWVKILGLPDFAETVPAGLLDALLSIPLVIFALIVLWRCRARSAATVPEAT
jgi:membrane protease YdiL (CAAX protease family)